MIAPETPMPDPQAFAAAGFVPLVEVTRGDIVESVHCGAAAVVTADGDVVASWGDVEQVVYPRSSIKMVQALPTIETGAAEAFALTDAELAIACASHVGTKAHVDTVAGMLERIGLTEDALACGPRPPVDDEAGRALTRAGVDPGRVHNGCSGKHAAMMLTAQHMGAPVGGYHKVGHPVQQRVIGALEQMTGLDLNLVPRSVDGCSLPIWALPLGNLALAFARIADPSDQPETRQAAIARLWRAIAAAPDMVEGPGLLVSEIMRLAPERIVVKNGAEGVFVAAIRDRGLGIAVKIADGGDRAARVAAAALLLQFAEPTGDLKAALQQGAKVPIHSWAGEPVGEIRPAASWMPRHR